MVRTNNLCCILCIVGTHIWGIFYWTRFGVYFEQDLGYIITIIGVYYNKNWDIYAPKFGVYYNKNCGMFWLKIGYEWDKVGVYYNCLGVLNVGNI